MAGSYKAQKEDFVSNLRGGSVAEINYVTAVAAAASILWSALQSRLSFFAPYTPLSFVVDLLLNAFAILFAVTIYSSSPLLLSILLLSPAILLTCLLPRAGANKSSPRKPPDASASSSVAKSSTLPQKPFLTTYRGSMMAITVIAILAVDFRVFPRRFAKVETWGTSLMDLGVGSFVFSSGVVAARAPLKAAFSSTVSPSSSPSLLSRLASSTRHSLPLLALAFIRLASVKKLEYAEHVSEYGVHWNFFFTLALLPPAVSLLPPPQHASSLSPIIAPVILTTVYQAFLSFTGLTAYMLTAPRTTLISANREGLVSAVGYLAIFLLGRSVGFAVLPRASTSTVSRRLASHAVVAALVYALSTDPRLTPFLLGFGSLTPSRRLVNLPYVAWVHAFNASQMLLFHLVHAFYFSSPSSSSSSSSSSTSLRSSSTIRTAAAATSNSNGSNKAKTSEDTRNQSRTSSSSTSRVLTALNRNGLAVFILANLLTGAVNLTVPTLGVATPTAMAILACYLLVVIGVAVGLDAKGWDIKI